MGATIAVAIGLAVGHVLGEALRPRLPRQRRWSVALVLLVGAASYAAAGMWGLWPVPLVAMALFVVASLTHRRAPESVVAWVALHVGVLVVIAALSGIALPAGIDAGRLPGAASVWAREVFAALTAGAGLVATVSLGGAFMNRAIRPFAVEMRGEGIVEAGGRVLEPLENGFRDGGRVIGYYERLLIYVFVLAGAPTAIGFLVAAKSILRFGEIRNAKDRKNAEYILIGTLMSFAYALLVAYGTYLALARLFPP